MIDATHLLWNNVPIVELNNFGIYPAATDGKDIISVKDPFSISCIAYELGDERYCLECDHYLFYLNSSKINYINRKKEDDKDIIIIDAIENTDFVRLTFNAGSGMKIYRNGKCFFLLEQNNGSGILQFPYKGPTSALIDACMHKSVDAYFVENGYYPVRFRQDADDPVLMQNLNRMHLRGIVTVDTFLKGKKNSKANVALCNSNRDPEEAMRKINEIPYTK